MCLWCAFHLTVAGAELTIGVRSYSFCRWSAPSPQPLTHPANRINHSHLTNWPWPSMAGAISLSPPDTGNCLPRKGGAHSLKVVSSTVLGFSLPAEPSWPRLHIATETGSRGYTYGPHSQIACPNTAGLSAAVGGADLGGAHYRSNILRLPSK